MKNNMPEKKYNLFFSQSKLSNYSRIEKPAVIFTPSSDRWNDFSLRTRFLYEVIEESENAPSVDGHIFLAFVDEKESDEGSANAVETRFSKGKAKLLAATHFPEFYTLQPSMESYRKFVKELGQKKAEKLLLSVSDLVAIGRRDPRPNWYRDALASKQFKLSFMRNAETFFAFQNAGSILGGLENESLEIISKALRLEFQLPTFKNPHVFEFGFEHDADFPKRIAVVIGKNGVGKSQALAHFAKALLYKKQYLTDDKGERPLISRLLAISSPGETGGTFPRPRKSQRISYRRISLGEKTRGDHQFGFGNVLVKLARSEETIKGRSRWDLFARAIGAVAQLDEIVIPLKDQKRSHAEMNVQNVAPIAEFRQGNEMRRLERWGDIDLDSDVYRLIDGNIFPLSSGQLTFIHLAAQICLNVENGTMVLLDEPEIHLHPNYISGFVSLLDRLLRESGSFSILSTHSTYFVREVVRSQVFVLRESEDRQIEVVKPRLKTLGADIGQISQFVFEDALFGGMLNRIRKKLRDNPSVGSELLERLKGELSSEAFMNLRREILDARDRV